MILFKACPRCGGDVDATYEDDPYCVQCSHRPGAALLGAFPAGGPISEGSMRMRVPDASAAKDRVAQGQRAPEVDPEASSCPRCGGFEAVRLDRLRRQDNVCYRCRACGHIFSPAAGREAAG